MAMPNIQYPPSIFIAHNNGLDKVTGVEISLVSLMASSWWKLTYAFTDPKTILFYIGKFRLMIRWFQDA